MTSCDKRLRPYVLACVALAACSSTAELPLGAAQMRWSQRPEEIGKLPIGRVVSSTRVDGSTLPVLVKPSSTGLAGTFAAQPDTAAVIRDASGKAALVYRHSVRLRSGEVQNFDLEYRFEPGDCVAIRPVRGGSPEVVAALPGQCD